MLLGMLHFINFASENGTKSVICYKICPNFKLTQTSKVNLT